MAWGLLHHPLRYDSYALCLGKCVAYPLIAYPPPPPPQDACGLLSAASNHWVCKICSDRPPRPPVLRSSRKLTRDIYDRMRSLGVGTIHLYYAGRRSLNIVDGGRVSHVHMKRLHGSAAGLPSFFSLRPFRPAIYQMPPRAMRAMPLTREYKYLAGNLTSSEPPHRKEDSWLGGEIRESEVRPEQHAAVFCAPKFLYYERTKYLRIHYSSRVMMLSHVHAVLRPFLLLIVLPISAQASAHFHACFTYSSISSQSS